MKNARILSFEESMNAPSRYVIVTMFGSVNHFHWHRKSESHNIFLIWAHMAWISYFLGTCKMCLMGDIKVRIYYSLSGNAHLSYASEFLYIFYMKRWIFTIKKVSPYVLNLIKSENAHWFWPNEILWSNTLILMGRRTNLGTQ